MKKYLKNACFLYTCLFLLMIPIVFLVFILEGKSFVWKPDGLDQHYPALLYYGKLLRGLFTGKGFPMIDFKIGLGFDTISTLNYYVIGDPLTLLSVFMTPDNSVLFYNFMILLRLYLSGISFILLMKYWKYDGLGTVLGALIYAFSGYALFAGLRHPFFLNPMIYLPLLLIGTEQVLKKNKPFLMIAMVFISALSNFYFLYDLTVIIIVYILFRYFTVYRKNYKNIFLGLLQVGLRTGGCYLLGAALASFIFIPILYAFSLNGRLNTSPHMVSGFLFYSIEKYPLYFQGLFAAIYPGYWTVLTFSPVIIVSLAVLFANKKYRNLQIIYLLCFLGLFIPAFGYFMNGFAYMANRWCFLISLLIAATFTVTFNKLFHLDKKEIAILFLEIILYGILAFALPSESIVKVTFFILLCILFFVLLLQKEWFRNKKAVSGFVISALVLFSLGFNGYGFFANRYYNYSHEFLSKEEVIKKTSKGALSLIPNIKDKSFYRIETYGDIALNEALTVGFNDVSGYYSLMNGDITSYLKDLEVLNQRTAFRFDNFDNRTILDELAGVKYFVSTDKNAAPFGYKLIKEVKRGSDSYYLFQNSYALPLGYTYGNYMLKEDYDKLSALEKQNAMMNAVILDRDTDFAAKADQNANFGIEKLNAAITPDANVSLDNNRIDIKKAGATITLSFDAKPNSETYVRFGKLNINNKKNMMTLFHAKGARGASKEINVRSIYYNSYFGKENYLINVGYSVDGKSKAVIKFPKIATYSYVSIDVYSVDMSSYTNQVNALNKTSFNYKKLFRNRIEGDITLGSKGVTVFSIPYSKGWSAYVDGVKEEIIPANVMYMALPLKEGNHHIILKYKTPYLMTGCYISLLASVVLIGTVIYNKATQKRRNLT